MSRLRFVLVGLALSVMTAALPATAATGTHLTDACGDAGSRVKVDDQKHTVEDAQGHVDLAGASIVNRDSGGIVVKVSTCGAISSEQGQYAVMWSFPDGCSQVLGWTRQSQDRVRTDPALTQILEYSETCYPENGGEPVDTFETKLPNSAAVFEGKTLTITLPMELVPAQARKRFVAGTEWLRPFARVVDRTGAWAFSFGEPEPEYELRYRVDELENVGATFVYGKRV